MVNLRESSDCNIWNTNIDTNSNNKLFTILGGCTRRIAARYQVQL